MACCVLLAGLISGIIWVLRMLGMQRREPAHHWRLLTKEEHDEK